MKNAKTFTTRTLFMHYLSKKILSFFYNKPWSSDYWEKRYSSGGTSGSGSYNRLAEFKADVLKSFIKR
ncbi:hypothetical protein [Botryobacter ruber]|uniref:hypothetical protein n=1 Tax=Botryobacter ruber TaxID=2171629 RepID=UPI000F648068|nr:hypothetical protein [Botryobacter ruber]